MTLPKRLIEVDLPIARISAHARREKSIRHGHISTLHIWWARRPLAACRAVVCAALWPDPADELCPRAFRDAAALHLVAFAKRVNPERITDEKKHLQDTLSPESRARWEVFAKGEPPLDPTDAAHQNVLRFALLDFIADFANWDNSTVPAYLETSRALTQAAHEALGGEPGTRPLVVDPFAGGGSIPLEALRVGADAFASDLNPVAVLLNKVVLEYIPKYGQKLADEVRKWGQWIKEQAEKELAEFYPKDPDGATPIAYLWARTIRCEGVGCGAEVPLMRSLWLAKKAYKSVALRVVVRGASDPGPLKAGVPSPPGPLSAGLPSPPGPLSLRERGKMEERLRVSELAGRGRRVPEALLRRARELRGKQTQAEQLLWECLRDRQLIGAKFRRQHNVGPFIADFYCHEAQLCVELDGGVHETAAQQEKDRLRDDWLWENGFALLRLPNDVVQRDPDNALQTIAAHLPLPADFPLSHRERGPGGEDVPFVDFEIIHDAKAKDVGEGTVKRGSATCPCCGFTTPVKSVRAQLKQRRGGAADVRLFCVVTTRPNVQGRFYRLPNESDWEAVAKAAKELEKRKKAHTGPLSLVPEEPLDVRGIRHTWAMIYGITTWGDLFSPRQALALTKLCRLVVEAGGTLAKEHKDGLAEAVQTCLAFVVDRECDSQSSLVTWSSGGEFIRGTFGRQALPFVWDFVECNALADSSGNWDGALNWVTLVLDACIPICTFP